MLAALVMALVGKAIVVTLVILVLAVVGFVAIIGKITGRD